MKRLAAPLLALALVAAACGGGNGHKVAARKATTTSSSVADTSTTSSGGSSTTATTAIPTSITARRSTTTNRPAPPAPPSAPVAVKLTRIASLSSPLAFAQAPNDDAIYVAQQSGQVRVVRDGAVSTVLDIAGSIGSGGERGLLGLAFAPNRPAMDVYYTARNGDVTIDEYPFSSGRVTGSPRNLVTVSHSEFANHNGGNLVYGPDGHLFAGTGDGGSGGDPHGHAQDPNSRLGKLLRIDAAANPAGVEIWMIGLRNPWRWSFDKATGEMWIGDVGQDEWEEVDVAAAGTHGQNWGWNRREGTHPYNGGAEPAGAVDPIYEYSHANNACAITGGYVYRGTRLAGWAGTYLFADECIGKVMALTRPGGRTSVRDTGLSTSALASFGEDRAGELYVLSLGGGLYRIDPR